MFKPADLFDLSQTEHAAIFDGCKFAWDALKKIESYIAANLKPALHNRCEGRAFIGEKVFIGEGTVVEDGAMIKGPAIIGQGCQIRHNAYIRENVIIGDGCVVGNSSELKNSLLFNNAQAPHFNYVGDSILGHKAHLGAGVKISNVKTVPRQHRGGGGRRAVRHRPAQVRRAAGRRRGSRLQRRAEPRQHPRARRGGLPERLLARHPAREHDCQEQGGN
jgi:NDP-sugar pyrophosphorylase family protein